MCRKRSFRIIRARELSGERRRVSYPVSDSMSCRRRANEHGTETRADKPAGRREYNEELPKKGLGGLTPVQYSKRLVAERSTVTIGL